MIATVLGIESSCDETGVAIYNRQHKLMAHVLHSQVSLHADYGGVVPELASRDHVKRVLPLIHQVLDQAHLKLHDIDGIAYTQGPGLLGALMVGGSIAQSLGFALNIPTLGVHHMEAHLLAPLLEEQVSFPFVALLVSGGHTMLVHVNGLGDYTLLGESLDDAAGEAFDKTAKLLGLGYPGGPKIAQYATHGDEKRFVFPRPMVDRPGLDFSFSGLKTFALNTINAVAAENGGLTQQDQADIAYAFQQAVVDTLVIKCKRAIQQTGADCLVMAGGVAANQLLRQRLAQQLAATVHYARPEFCTDNGAMVAFAGFLRLSQQQTDTLGLEIKPRWPLCELKPP